MPSAASDSACTSSSTARRTCSPIAAISFVTLVGVRCPVRDEQGPDWCLNVELFADFAGSTRSRHVQPLCQPGEVMAGLTALLADPTQDELAADEVVADLFGRVTFGIEKDRQRLVTAIPCAVGAGNLDPVPDPTFDRQRRDIHPRTEIDRDLQVSQLDCGGHPVDGDVGRTGSGPEVIGVRA